MAVGDANQAKCSSIGSGLRVRHVLRRLRAPRSRGPGTQVAGDQVGVEGGERVLGHLVQVPHRAKGQGVPQLLQQRSGGEHTVATAVDQLQTHRVRATGAWRTK